MPDPTSLELPWSFAPRVVTEHLGHLKYATTARALGELVANAFDATATSVRIDIASNDLDVPVTFTVTDNGRGISPAKLRDRFFVVGVDRDRSIPAHKQLGRLGVGRLAVHRIGEISEWESISSDDGKRIRVRFRLQTAAGGPVKVEVTGVSGETPTGTSIEISNLCDKISTAATVTRLGNDLVGQFCAYLLGNQDRRIYVQGQELDVRRMIAHDSREDIEGSNAFGEGATIRHLILSRAIQTSRTPTQLLFAAKGRTITAVQPPEVPSPEYIGLVECDYLDTLVTANREDVLELDEGFTKLRNRALDAVALFSTKYREREAERFIESARRQPFYPYKEAPADIVTTAEQNLYDLVLEKVNEHANIEGMTLKQQAVVFRLLARALGNENLLEILHEVATLSDADIDKFKKVLERTTLDSIIRLSSEVTARLTFLDVLHELVYGDTKKRLAERTQLHKILEPHCWLFGPQFHLATSDKSFRTVVKRHRELAHLPFLVKVDLAAIKGVDDIPDLYLAAQKDYPVAPRHHSLLVELKAPRVSLGIPEIDQGRRYARTIMKSSEFDKTSTRWDIFVVSGHASDDAQVDRQQKDKPHGLLNEWENMRVWAFEWSEIITRAREEMHLVREHLQNKSKELAVSEYLRENFPEVLRSLENPPTKKRKGKAGEADERRT